MIFLIFTLVATFIIGCQNPSSYQSPTANLFTTGDSLPNDDNNGLKAQAIATSHPNQFTVALTWDSISSSAERWKITREPENETEPVKWVEGNAHNYQDEKVEAGKTYRYLLWKERQNDLSLSSTTIVTIPEDKVISGDVITSQLIGFHRLYLERGSRLIANREGLRIEAQEIISNGATIQSFLDPSSVRENKSASSGGPILIQAKVAKGSIKIIAQGEDGAPGIEGKPGRDGNPGKRGLDGKSTSIIAAFKSYVDPEIANFRYLNNQTEAEEFKARIDRLLPGCHPLRAKYERCSRKPEPGTPGENGEKGQDGGPGGKGGDSSTVVVAINDPKGLALEVLTEPGHGGTPGLGGKGGLGGQGGEAGSLDPHCVCPRETFTPIDGKSGPPGKDGSKGENGNRSPVCVILAGAEQGDCLFFKTSASENHSAPPQ